jgi:hypothetical protein
VVPLSAAGSHDLRVLWDVRRLSPVYLGLRQVPGEEGGEVVGAHAMQVQVDLWRPFDRGPCPGGGCAARAIWWDT